MGHTRDGPAALHPNGRTTTPAPVGIAREADGAGREGTPPPSTTPPATPPHPPTGHGQRQPQEWHRRGAKLGSAVVRNRQANGGRGANIDRDG